VRPPKPRLDQGDLDSPCHDFPQPGHTRGRPYPRVRGAMRGIGSWHWGQTSDLLRIGTSPGTRGTFLGPRLIFGRRGQMKHIRGAATDTDDRRPVRISRWGRGVIFLARSRQVKPEAQAPVHPSQARDGDVLRPVGRWGRASTEVHARCSRLRIPESSGLFPVSVT
jgi:hypothetical protein